MKPVQRRLNRRMVSLAATVAVAGGMHGLAQQAATKTATESYQGISQPPADDMIEVTSEDGVVAAKPKPAAAKVQAPQPVAVETIASNKASATVASTPALADSDVIADPVGTAPKVQHRDGSSAVGHAAAPSSAAVNNPDGEVVTLRPLKPGEIREGTVIRVRLLEGLSSGETRTGQRFAAQVIQDVTESGQVLIPSGSEISGYVVQSQGGTHISGNGSLRLRPDYVTLPDGARYVVRAQVIGAPHTGMKTNDEGTIRPVISVKNRVIVAGAMTGGGAVTGALLGGPMGAAVGAIIGAGAYTVHSIQQTHQADLPVNSELLISLSEPVQMASVSVRAGGNAAQ